MNNKPLHTVENLAVLWTQQDKGLSHVHISRYEKYSYHSLWWRHAAVRICIPLTSVTQSEKKKLCYQYNRTRRNIPWRKSSLAWKACRCTFANTKAFFRESRPAKPYVCTGNCSRAAPSCYDVHKLYIPISCSMQVCNITEELNVLKQKTITTSQISYVRSIILWRCRHRTSIMVISGKNALTAITLQHHGNYSCGNRNKFSMLNGKNTHCDTAPSNHILYLCLSVSFVPQALMTEKIALWNVSMKWSRTFNMPLTWRPHKEKSSYAFTQHMPVLHKWGTFNRDVC